MRFAPQSAADRIAQRKGGFGIPPEAVVDPRSGPAGEAITYERAGAIYAIAWRGSSYNKEFYYRYRDEASRQYALDRFFKSLAECAAYKEKCKAERAAAPRGLEVGDVLRCTWGYDQTNVNYYEVTRLVGKRQVEIREIAQEMKEDQGWLRGSCSPMPGRYTGKPMIKYARNGSVGIASYASASKVEPIAEVAGKKLYRPDNYTAYA